MNISREIATRVTPNFLRASRANYADSHPASAAALFSVNIVTDSNPAPPHFASPTLIRYNPSTFAYLVEDNVVITRLTDKQADYTLKPNFVQQYNEMWEKVISEAKDSAVIFPDVTEIFKTGVLDEDLIHDDYSAYLYAIAIRNYVVDNPTAANWNLAANTFLRNIAIAGRGDVAVYALRLGFAKIANETGGVLSDDAIKVYGSMLSSMGKFSDAIGDAYGITGTIKIPSGAEVTDKAQLDTYTRAQITQAVTANGYGHLADVFGTMFDNKAMTSGKLMAVASDKEKLRELDKRSIRVLADFMQEAILNDR